MKCGNCYDKGFIESVTLHSGCEYLTVAVCPKCKDMQAFNERMKYLQEHPPTNTMRFSADHVCEVIPFPIGKRT